jgi:hypothetical protein
MTLIKVSVSGALSFKLCDEQNMTEEKQGPISPWMPLTVLNTT